MGGTDRELASGHDRHSGRRVFHRRVAGGNRQPGDGGREPALQLEGHTRRADDQAEGAARGGHKDRAGRERGVHFGAHGDEVASRFSEAESSGDRENLGDAAREAGEGKGHRVSGDGALESVGDSANGDHLVDGHRRVRRRVAEEDRIGRRLREMGELEREIPGLDFERGAGRSYAQAERSVGHREAGHGAAVERGRHAGPDSDEPAGRAREADTAGNGHEIRDGRGKALHGEERGACRNRAGESVGRSAGVECATGDDRGGGRGVAGEDPVGRHRGQSRDRGGESALEFEGRSARVGQQAERAVDDFEEGPLALGAKRGVDARANRHNRRSVQADTQRSDHRETAFHGEISGSRSLEDSTARSVSRKLDAGELAGGHDEQCFAGRIIDQASIAGPEIEEKRRVRQAARESRHTDHRGRIAASFDRQPAAGAVPLRQHHCGQRGIHHLHAHGVKRPAARSGEGAQFGAADGQKVCRERRSIGQGDLLRAPFDREAPGGLQETTR